MRKRPSSSVWPTAAGVCVPLFPSGTSWIVAYASAVFPSVARPSTGTSWTAGRSWRYQRRCRGAPPGRALLVPPTPPPQLLISNCLERRRPTCTAPPAAL